MIYLIRPQLAFGFSRGGIVAQRQISAVYIFPSVVLIKLCRSRSRRSCGRGSFMVFVVFYGKRGHVMSCEESGTIRNVVVGCSKVFACPSLTQVIPGAHDIIGPTRALSENTHGQGTNQWKAPEALRVWVHRFGHGLWLFPLWISNFMIFFGP